MRAHYLQHVPFEGLGSIEPWLRTAGYAITATRFFAAEELPAADELDLLVVMGGPMSVTDEDEFPWLVREKRFVREVIGAGKPVLGICLGAQLVASAMGARIFPNRAKEIGWFPVNGVALNDPGNFKFPHSIEAFHWHGETFDLPTGATLIARSAGCEHQAFQLGDKVLGLQFHLETTPDAARTMVAHCGDELIPAQYVQPAKEILAAPVETYQAINQLMGKVLEFLLERTEVQS